VEQEKLVALFQQEFDRCKVRRGETAIVLSGERSSSAYAQAALRAISNLGAHAFQMHMPTLRPEERPDAKEGTFVGLTPVTGQRLAVETLKKADFVVDLLLLLHSPEQVEILQAGTRMLLVVEPPEILERMMPTDELRRQIEAGSEVLKRARTLRVTSSAGTDFEMNLGQYPVVTQYGFTDTPGRWDHWPSAFLYTWPDEGSTNGRVVLNKGDFVWPLNRYVDSTITLTVRDGYIHSIEGETDARILKDQMESFHDPEAYAVSHIGWGVDRRAQWDSVKKEPLSVGTDPRSYAGNVQFSTGPNTEAGGKRHTIAHFDMPMLGCTLTLDGKAVVRDGQVVGV
jgi:2,5-dihydroxypyridine 5,6-dioxygenase